MEFTEELIELLEYEPSSGSIKWKEISSNRRRGEYVKTQKTHNGYLTFSFKGRTIYLHKAAWLLHYGEWPPLQVDHINMVKTDNRIPNLRACSNSENNCNRTVQSNSTTGIKGVSWNKQTQRWNAKIRKDGKTLYSRFFRSLSEAETQVRIHRDIFHGEFSRH